MILVQLLHLTFGFRVGCERVPNVGCAALATSQNYSRTLPRSVVKTRFALQSIAPNVNAAPTAITTIRTKLMTISFIRVSDPYLARFDVGPEVLLVATFR